MFFRTAVLLLALLFSVAHAYKLHSTYKFTDHAITSKSLFPEIEKDFPLLTIPANKTRYRVTAATLINSFNRHGIQIDTASMRSVIFIKKSPIDLTALEEKVHNFYVGHYPSITIHKITITPRIYTDALPERYEAEFGNKSARHSKGTFYIRTEGKRKLFFDYTIDATVGIVHAKYDLKRKAELTSFNTVTLNVKLGAIRGKPLTQMQPHQYRLKQNIKANAALSRRDVESSPMVKRGKQLLVSIKSGAVLIEFAAVALEDGALYDIIAIRKADGQRIKAKVTGVNQVEIQ